MNFIFCKLKKPQKTWILFFVSAKDLVRITALVFDSDTWVPRKLRGFNFLSMLLGVVGNSKQTQKKRKRAWSQLELNDRMRVNESFVLNGETVRRGEIFTIIMIKSNDLVLMKSDTKLIEITSSSRYFQYFEKVEHVNLDDVEKTVTFWNKIWTS